MCMHVHVRVMCTNLCLYIIFPINDIINQLQVHITLSQTIIICNIIPYINMYEAQALEPFDIYLNLYSMSAL